jgi:hypothetical protein
MKEIEVKAGDWFLDENGKEIQLLAVVGNWCMVQDYEQNKPFILELEFVSAIFNP